MHRAEVITVERRRRWSWTDKQQIVDETLMPGASISAVARRYGHPSQVFAWRKAVREGDIVAPAVSGAFERTFAPVVVSGSRLPPFGAVDGGHGDRAAQRPPHCGGRRCGFGGARPRHHGTGTAMITLASGTRVWLAVGRTDMRKGFDGLSALVQQKLAQDPFCGHLFVFRGRRGDLLKVMWYDGQGLCLFAKRLEKGRFVWPSPADGKVVISPAQLGMLLEGIDWRMPQRTWRPQPAG